MSAEHDAKLMEGCAALTRALDTIGRDSTGNDSDLAKHVVEAELQIRAVIRSTLRRLGESA